MHIVKVNTALFHINSFICYLICICGLDFLLRPSINKENKKSTSGIAFPPKYNKLRVNYIVDRGDVCSHPLGTVSNVNEPKPMA